MTTSARNIPTILVAFGATGDLMRLKVLPALYNLYARNELPTMFRVIGFSRRELDDDGFRAHVRSCIKAHGDVEAFLSLFSFERGQFDDAKSYAALKKRVADADNKWGVCSNKLFYLSVAPEFYDGILQNLSHSGLTDPCSPEEGWSRVIVEKPFGTDMETAQKLDEQLGLLFKEEQIYRIDHYPAKEMLQNILVFRFANNLFELPWGNKLIESIHIKALEPLGAEKRGAFYDSVGALRDVGQNHLLQILALLTMERPESFAPEAVRPKRAAILNALTLHSKDDVVEHTARAQYEGFRDIEGVAEGSQTETYFKVRATLDTPRWSGVPITLEAGKRFAEPDKKITVTLKHPTPCLCPPGMHHTNEIVIRLEPKEEILIHFWSKRPGLTTETQPQALHFLLREPHARMQYTEEYEKLLLDCVAGDQLLFLTTDEVRAMWRFIDPIVAAWKEGATELNTYPSGSAGYPSGR